MKAPSMTAWTLQRWSAMVLALCVVVHLITMILAVHSGLTAQAILGRLRGNVAWGMFYLAFVAAATVHVPIGLRNIALEWLGWRGTTVRIAAALVAVLFAIAGATAVYGLVWSAA